MVHEAGRVEQDIDLADLLGHRVDRGGVANVEPCRLGDAFLGEGGDAAFVDVGGDHRGAFARKGDGAGAADAGGRGGDESAFALQAIRHSSSPGVRLEFRVVIARSEATKQSMLPLREQMDCSSLRSRNDGRMVQ